MSFGSRRGGSCLIVLIVLALVGALIFVIARLNAVEKERAEERRAAEAKPVEKTPEQLKRERINEMLIQLEKSIISEWNDLVEGDYKEEPFTMEELERVDPRMRFRYAIGEGIEYAYGTTMLVNVITNDFWFGIHIGDGECVAVDFDDKFPTPFPMTTTAFTTIRPRFATEKLFTICGIISARSCRKHFLSQATEWTTALLMIRNSMIFIR